MTKNSPIVTFALFLVLTLSIFAVNQDRLWAAAPDSEDEWISSFVEYVKETIKTDGIPGAAVALVRDNDIRLADGFGLQNVTANTPVTPETLFHIGSTHKSMNALLIATLVDDGLLNWDTPIVEIDPEFELSDPEATGQLTIRHLLSMSSGIPDEAEDDLPENTAPEDIFDAAAETDLLGQPGETFSYSNVSAALAGYLGVMAAGGDSDDLHAGYARLLEERILGPIGMETATISASEAHASPNMSKSYTYTNDREPVEAKSYDVDSDALAPSGSLKANINEMALYISTVLNGGIAPNGNRVVS